MKVRSRQWCEDYGFPAPDSLTKKQLDGYENLALKCLDGTGDTYESMALVLLLCEALRLERAKKKPAST